MTISNLTKMAESSPNRLKYVGKGEIAHHKQFLLSYCVFRRLVLQTRINQGLFRIGLIPIFSSTGRRPASYFHGVVSVVRPSLRLCVHASVNSSFKKLLLRNCLLDFYEISQECSLGSPLSNDCVL